jgi:hypothetical protein
MVGAGLKTRPYRFLHIDFFKLHNFFQTAKRSAALQGCGAADGRPRGLRYG